MSKQNLMMRCSADARVRLQLLAHRRAPSAAFCSTSKYRPYVAAGYIVWNAALSRWIGTFKAGTSAGVPDAE
jgi:hypothetical protein